MIKRACIVIPMYNEERHARQSVGTILAGVRSLPAEVRLVLVDDGSADRTRALLEECAAASPDIVTVIVHPRNKGYGAALRTGIAFAIDNGYEYVLFMDSDLTNHPRYLRAFYDRMLEGVDYIKASRYGKNAGVSGVPWHRRLVSFCGNSVARLLSGVPLHDLTNGFRAVKTSLLAKIRLTENGFAVIMEELFLVKPLARSYAEIPYVLTSRTAGQGKTHFTYDLKTYAAYLRYALKSARVRRPVV
ncbi:MAG TPA: glycosyltransferase family 2 protein [Candidatus Omnitrophota bacterium]|nr:glycosyltransferase family 2 protein [Candidatus Omnitrophota bacterium]HRZ15831.1 glycosyltransferase family 2 protein [Candidatus Omnitrophota bacterium]